MGEQTLNELLEDVNNYVSESQNADYFVVGDSPAADAPADGETVTDAPEEGLTADDVQQIVQDALAEQSNNADVSALVEMQAAQQYGYLPNFSSSQMSYFEGVLSAHPFVDYYAVYDGNNNYSLYYGYGLKAEGGQNCEYIRITYSNYSQYTIDKGSTVSPAVDSGQATYCSYVDTCARFPRVEMVKYETFTTISLICALGLWVLGKLFFR